MYDIGDVGVLLGLEVGRTAYHGHASPRPVVREVHCKVAYLPGPATRRIADQSSLHTSIHTRLTGTAGLR